MAPKISVLMGVYNGAPYLTDAVNSILAQTFRDFEFIIIDDGSTDETPEILSKLTAQDDRIIVVVNENNIGLTRSLIKGIKMSRGTYVARMDADDLSRSDRFELLNEILDGNPDIDVVGSCFEAIDERGQVLAYKSVPETNLEIQWLSIFHNPFTHGSTLIRNDIFTKLGGSYDPTISCGQDFDLWVRILKIAKGYNVREPLLQLREHGGQISVQRYSDQQGYAEDISRKQIQHLLGGVTIKDDTVKFLRRVSKGVFPGSDASLTEVASLYFHLFRVFELQVGGEVSARALRKLRQGVATALARSIPLRYFTSLPGIRLAVTLFNFSPKAFMAAFGDRTIDRMR